MQALTEGEMYAFDPLGVIPAFKSGDLAMVAGRLAADETMHWTALTGALGKPLPTAPLTFGA